MDTMILTKRSAVRLRTTQRAIKRAMLGISIRSDEIQRKTRVTDLVRRVAELKWRWAGHAARQIPSRWTNKISPPRARQKDMQEDHQYDGGAISKK